MPVFRSKSLFFGTSHFLMPNIFSKIRTLALKIWGVGLGVIFISTTTAMESSNL